MSILYNIPLNIYIIPLGPAGWNPQLHSFVPRHLRRLRALSALLGILGVRGAKLSWGYPWIRWIQCGSISGHLDMDLASLCAYVCLAIQSISSWEKILEVSTATCTDLCSQMENFQNMFVKISKKWEHQPIRGTNSSGIPSLVENALFTFCQENSRGSTEGRSLGRDDCTSRSNHGPNQKWFRTVSYLIWHPNVYWFVITLPLIQWMYLFLSANNVVNCAHHVIPQCLLAGSVNPPESSLKNMIIIIIIIIIIILILILILILFV